MRRLLVSVVVAALLVLGRPIPFDEHGIIRDKDTLGSIRSLHFQDGEFVPLRELVRVTSRGQVIVAPDVTAQECTEIQGALRTSILTAAQRAVIAQQCGDRR